VIGLDTNVLVRLLTADEPAQVKVAIRLLAAHEAEVGAFFINDMVLVEVMWVLGRSYGISRLDAVDAMRSLLHNDAFAFEDRDRLTRAVALCTQQAVDFSDTMIALKNASALCEHTVTFDRAMRGLPNVQVI
jgi:predicted nucleic-acid-binding protein